MGTAQYLSPEQAQGHAVSARSDLYSVGVTLYELLTGRVPFEGDSAVSIALKQVAEEPVPPSRLNPAVPGSLDAVVLRALAKDPADRFEDADAFIAALEAVRAEVTGATAVAPAYATTAFAPVAPPLPAPTGAYPAPLTGPAPAAAVLPADPVAARRRPWWPWALAALLVAAAVVAALLLVGGTEERPVPAVVGADQGAAARRLRDEGFRPAFVRVRNERPRDQVISQQPEAGTELEVGSEVSLTVSDGPGEATVPEVASLTRASAVARLERAGFRSRVRREASATVPEGRVIRSTPGEGSQATVGTTVTLVVSSGPEQVDVPGVVGRTLPEARAALAAAGLTVEVEREESTEAAEGTVLRQTPAEDEQVAAGATVTLTVAQEVEQVDVPSVTGRTESEAAETLSGAGLQVDITTRAVTAPDEDGIVLEQRPAGGAEADRGATVTITVGRFDDSAPDPEGDGAAPDDGADDGGAGGTGDGTGDGDGTGAPDDGGATGGGGAGTPEAGGTPTP